MTKRLSHTLYKCLDMSSIYANDVLYTERTKNCHHWNHVVTKFHDFSDDSHWSMNPTKDHGQPTAIIAELPGEICGDTSLSYIAIHLFQNVLQVETTSEHSRRSTHQPIAAPVHGTGQAYQHKQQWTSGQQWRQDKFTTCKSGPRTSAENALTSLQHKKNETELKNMLGPLVSRRPTTFLVHFKPSKNQLDVRDGMTKIVGNNGNHWGKFAQQHDPVWQGYAKSGKSTLAQLWNIWASSTSTQKRSNK